jgi:hypothetical protein
LRIKETSGVGSVPCDALQSLQAAVGFANTRGWGSVGTIEFRQLHGLDSNAYNSRDLHSWFCLSLAIFTFRVWLISR